MNKIKIFRILPLITLLFLFSCDNEPVDPTVSLKPVDSVDPASFKVSFSGQTYIATQVSAVITDGEIAINALKGSELESFSIAVSGAIAGSYLTNENPIIYNVGTGQAMYTSVNPVDTTANTGKITITSVNEANKTISGYFEFLGYNKTENFTLTKEFTNGFFVNIPYITN